MESIQIGNQIWSLKNLDTDRFRNGDPIPEVKTVVEWHKAGEDRQPAWCYYENDTSNGEKYGKLYNWYAVSDSRGLCPTGWHVPSDSEWTVLTDYLGGEKVAGVKMKSTSGWYNHGNGNNRSGFSGLPGGCRLGNGAFYYIGKAGHWWSSKEADTYYAWFRYLGYDYEVVGRDHFHKYNGMRVRCLKD